MKLILTSLLVIDVLKVVSFYVCISEVKNNFSGVFKKILHNYLFLETVTDPTLGDISTLYGDSPYRG